MPRGSEIETTAAAPVAAPAAPAAPAPKKPAAVAASATGGGQKAAPAAGAPKTTPAAPAAPAAAPAGVPVEYASIVQRSIFDSEAAEAAAAAKAESDAWYEKEAERATARPPEDPALLRAAQERLGNVRKLREEAQIGPVTAGTKTERELQRVRRQLKEGSILPAAMSAAKLMYEATPKTPLTVARMGSTPTFSTEFLQYQLGKKLAGFQEEAPAPTYDGTQYPSVKPEVATRAKPSQFGQTEATIIPDRPPQTPSETALNRPVVGAREALDIGRAYTRARGQEKWARSLINERLSDPDSTPDQIRGAAAARQVALKEVARLRASLREYGWMDDEEVEKTFGAPK